MPTKLSNYQTCTAAYALISLQPGTVQRLIRLSQTLKVIGKLESDIQFTGSVGNLTAYRMQGVDKIVVRRKGGPSKDRIKNGREFKVTRLNNSEFQGRARGVHWIMGALYAVRRVADHNLCGGINRSMKLVQSRDHESPLGKRSIILSKHGSVLEGFSMNRFSVFEGLVRTPLKHNITKNTLTAIVTIPELIPQVNFFPPEKHSLFSVMAQLSVVPDLFWTDNGYQPSDPKYGPWNVTGTTPWLHTTETSPSATLELKLDGTPPDEKHALILSVCIQFGAAHAGKIEAIKHAGCGKVMAVV